MKPLVLVMMLAACAAVSFASDDLLDAAKDAKAKRRKSTTKVITNADVKKSKATNTSTAKAPAPAQAHPELSPLEKNAATRQAARIVAERKIATEKLVADLEKELAAIEQRYYEENDLDRRDTEIVKRFNTTKEKLDAARKELAALDAQLAAPPPAPES